MISLVFARRCADHAVKRRLTRAVNAPALKGPPMAADDDVGDVLRDIVPGAAEAAAGASAGRSVPTLAPATRRTPSALRAALVP